MEQRPCVYMRLCPSRTSEVGRQEELFEFSGADVVQWKKEKDGRTLTKKMRFDAIFKETATQQELYTGVGTRALSAAKKGFRSAIIAYGATGTGKTFTMDGGLDDRRAWGLIPRLLREVYEFKEKEAHEDFRVSLQYVQLYRDTLEDLGVEPNTDPKQKNVQLRGTGENWELVSSAHIFCNFSEALNFYMKARARRKVSKTDLNSESSRSHAMLVVTMEWTADARHKGVLHFVDLAGSEELDNLPAGLQREEYISITKNLNHLGLCIGILGKNAQKPGKAKHVPFRNARLTQLLSPCFSGKGDVSILITSTNDIGDRHDAERSMNFGKDCLELPIQLQLQGVMVNNASIEQVVGDLDNSEGREGVCKDVDSQVVMQSAIGMESVTGDEEKAMREELTGLRAQLAEHPEYTTEHPTSSGVEEGEEQIQLRKLVQQKLEEANKVDAIEKTIKELQERMQNIHEAQQQLQDGTTETTSKDPFQVQQLQDCSSELSKQFTLESANHSLALLRLDVAKRELAHFMSHTAGRTADDSLVKQMEQHWHEMQQLKSKVDELKAALDVTGEDDVQASAELKNNDNAEVKIGMSLEDDLQSFSVLQAEHELELAYKGLPATCRKVVHLIQLHPMWKARFRELGGVQKCLRYMQEGKHDSTHQSLAHCLSAVLDTEGLKEAHEMDIVAQMFRKMVDNDPEDFLHCSDQRRIIYLKLVAKIAVHLPIKAKFVARSSGLLPVVLKLVEDPVQEVQASAITALGELAYIPEAETLPADAEATLGQPVLEAVLICLETSESEACLSAAARCLTKLCRGARGNPVRLDLIRIDAPARLYKRVKEMISDGGDEETVQYIKCALLLLLEKRTPLLERRVSVPDADVRRFVLQAVAYASAKVMLTSGKQQEKYSSQAGNVEYHGHVLSGSWSASGAGFSAGGGQQCSTYFANPAYHLRLRSPREGTANLAIMLLDADNRKEQELGKQARHVFLGMHLVRMVDVAKSQHGNEFKDEHIHSLQDLVSRGLSPIPSRSGGHAPAFLRGRQNSLSAEVDSPDEFLLNLSLDVPLQESRFVVSIFADCEVDICSLAHDGWHRQIFVGHWVDTVLNGFQDPCWRECPQLQVVNTGQTASQMYFILSYKELDDKNNLLHKQCDEYDTRQTVQETRPHMSMRLFNISEQPMHRYVGSERDAVQSEPYIYDDYVTMRVEVPPSSVHALSLARTFGRNGQPPDPLPDIAKQFRVQVLSESAAAKVVPFGEQSKWHAFFTDVRRADNVTGRKEKSDLRHTWLLHLSEGASEGGKHIVHLIVDTTMPSKVYTKLEVRQAGQEPLRFKGQSKETCTNNGLNRCCELPSGGDWEVTLLVHSESAPGCLYRISGFSMFCEASLRPDHGEVAVPVEPRDSIEEDFMQKARMLQGQNNPSPNCFLEESTWPTLTRDLADSKEEDDQCNVTVPQAYLQKLHSEVLRLRHGQ